MESLTVKINKPLKLSPDISHIETRTSLWEGWIHPRLHGWFNSCSVCFAPPVVLKQRISVNVRLRKLQETSVGLNKTDLNLGGTVLVDNWLFQLILCFLHFQRCVNIFLYIFIFHFPHVTTSLQTPCYTETWSLLHLQFNFIISIF